MVNTDKKGEVLLLRSQNYSIRVIAEKTKLSKETVANIIRDNREEVEALTSIEMDELLKEVSATKRDRIVSLSRQLKKVEEEIGERDLSDIPTDKLFKVLLDLQKELRVYTDSESLTSTEEAKDERDSRICTW